MYRDCWEDDASKRPNVASILLQLNEMLGDYKLTEQVDQFLAARQSWSTEFEKQIQVVVVVVIW